MAHTTNQNSLDKVTNPYPNHPTLHTILRNFEKGKRKNISLKIIIIPNSQKSAIVTPNKRKQPLCSHEKYLGILNHGQ